MKARFLPAAALLGLACSSGDGPYGTSQPPPPPAGPTATNAVDIQDSFFSPAAASVAMGATVTWTWRGSLEHTLTFEDGQ